MTDATWIERARAEARRSPDPRTKVGALVVAAGVAVGRGCNDFPPGEGALPWTHASPDGDPYKTKHPYVVHAEMAALADASAPRGSTLYTTLGPCENCAKLAIVMGVTRVVYGERREKPDAAAGLLLLRRAGVEVAFEPGSFEPGSVAAPRP